MSNQNIPMQLTTSKSSRSLAPKNDGSRNIIPFSNSYSSISISEVNDTNSILQPSTEVSTDQEQQPNDQKTVTFESQPLNDPQKVVSQNVNDSQKLGETSDTQKLSETVDTQKPPIPQKLNEQQPPSYSAVSLLSMTNFSTSGFNSSITLCDAGLFILPGLAESIPPRHTHFISVDSSSSKCQLASVTDKQRPIFLTASSEFALSTHVSVSTNGVFAVFSFANGFVNVAQIVHLLKKPVSLRFFSSFWLPIGCFQSVLFSIDFICASLFITSDSSNVVYLWNYSTQLLHRIIKPTISVIGLIADDNEGTLTLYGKNDIEQYTINGLLIRTFHSEFDITVCKLFHYSPTYDGRFIVIGDTRGHITCIKPANVNDNSDDEKGLKKSFYSFEIVGSKSVHKHPVASLFFSFSRECIASVDTRGNACLTKLNPRGCKIVNNTDFASKLTDQKQAVNSNATDEKKRMITQSFSSIENIVLNQSNSIIASNNNDDVNDNKNDVKISIDNDDDVKKRDSKLDKSDANVTFGSNGGVVNHPGGDEKKSGKISKSSSSFIFSNFQNMEIDRKTTRCAICENVASEKCKNCGMPLCSSCIDDVTNLCPNCNAELSNSLE